MARAISLIENQILSQISNDPILGSLLTSTSNVAIYKLLAFIVATSEGLEEQLMDSFISQVEIMIAEAAPATAPWIQNQAFLFQYNATNPQLIQFNTLTFAPFYPVINSAYQIINQCSVTAGQLNQVNVKVATGTPPGVLSNDQLSAFQYYLNQIKPVGIIYNAISLPSDKIFCQATVQYQGVYSAVISNNLLTAYNNYLSSIPFDGIFKLIDLEISLRQVTGVNDISFTNVTIRPDFTPFPGGTQIVINNTVQFREYSTVSGYVTDENTSGKNFVNQLTLLPQ